MLQIKSFTFNPFAENTYVLYDETKEAIIIDPGCNEKLEFDQLFSFIENNQLIPVKVVNTHAHIDHVFGVAAVKRKFNIPFWLHKMEEPVLKAVKSYAANYGFVHFDEPEIEHYLQEGTNVTFGNTSLQVLFVPGHAPGHIALVDTDSKNIIAGDVLFRQSIGRTDLPGGDFDTLINSIKTQLFTLPDDYTVYAGHMEPTTIGFEKKNNPFLN